MAQPNSTPPAASHHAGAAPALDETALDAALEALRSYDHGSSRGALMPIDDAVTRALRDEKLRERIESRLIDALRDAASTVAREYVCRKLALMGSKAAVPPLARLLSDAAVTHEARNALESIPGLESIAALRSAVNQLSGPLKIGAIQSLGARRDADSVKVLTRLLTGADAAVAMAAGAALGLIGTVEAGRALRDFVASIPQSHQGRWADALFQCADQLTAQQQRAEARKLYDLLSAAHFPTHVRNNAGRRARGD